MKSDIRSSGKVAGTLLRYCALNTYTHTATALLRVTHEYARPLNPAVSAFVPFLIVSVEFEFEFALVPGANQQPTQGSGLFTPEWLQPSGLELGLILILYTIPNYTKPKPEASAR